MLKRLIDFTAAAAGLIALSPLFVFLYFLLLFRSGTPVIFAQSRVGRNKKTFRCYKFRTMRTGTPELGTHEVAQNNITPLGRTLRRFKLDELPQLWNVLSGDMSLVGPRPCLPNQSALIAERDKRGVFAIRPGITGLAQTQGIDMSQPEKLAEIDRAYMQRQSLLLDLKLIIKTLV